MLWSMAAQGFGEVDDDGLVYTSLVAGPVRLTKPDIAAGDLPRFLDEVSPSSPHGRAPKCSSSSSSSPSRASRTMCASAFLLTLTRVLPPLAAPHTRPLPSWAAA